MSDGQDEKYSKVSLSRISSGQIFAEAMCEILILQVGLQFPDLVGHMRKGVVGCVRDLCLNSLLKFDRHGDEVVMILALETVVRAYVVVGRAQKTSLEVIERAPTRRGRDSGLFTQFATEAVRGIHVSTL